MALEWANKRFRSSEDRTIDILSGAVATGVKRANTTGSYVGRFKRPRRASIGRVALYGSRQDREVYGSISRNHVVAVGTSPYNTYEVGKIIGMALLRDILRKDYNWISAEPTEIVFNFTGAPGTPVPSDASIRSVPCSMEFFSREFGTASDAQYVARKKVNFRSSSTIASNEVSCIADFGEWFALNVFSNSYFGGAPSTSMGQNELWGYQLYEYDISGTTVTEKPARGAIEELSDRKVSVFGYNKLTVQNVTIADNSATGDANSTERVDRNPIKGKLFKFKGPYPLARAYVFDRGIGFNPVIYDRNSDNLIVPNMPTGTSTSNSLLTQLPNTEMFENCTGVASCALEPGAIKDFASSFKISGTIPDLIRRFAIHDTVVNSRFLSRAFNYSPVGDSYLLFMEKRMSTGAAAVTLNYQLDCTISAVMGKRRSIPTQPLVITPVNYGTGTEILT